MPSTTALIADLLKSGDRNVVRQMVFVKDPTRDDQFQVLTRQLTTSATAKHWKRWPIAGSSIDNEPSSWIFEYAQMHGTRDFALSAAFVVEVTPSEWEELTTDATPRSLMIRIDRAREAIGAGMFVPESRFDASTPAMVTEALLTQIQDWRTASTPEIAPSGRARTPRVTRPEPAPVAPGAPTPEVSDVNTSAPVMPGDRITMADGTIYVARKIDADLSDVEMLRRARAAQQYAFLYSIPGTGKTRACMAAFGESLLTLVGSADTEVSDIVGTYVPTGKAGEFRWVDSVLLQAMTEGRPLLIDEVALIDPRVMSIVYSATDGRKELVVSSNPARGTVKAKDGFYIVYCTNPSVAGARLSEALLSRCGVQLEYSTDYAIMEALGVPRTFVVLSKNLETKRMSQEISTAPQARECLQFRDNVELFGETFALRNVVASAPEQDRDVYADVCSRAYGREIKALRTI